LDSWHVIFNGYPILCHWPRRRSVSNSCSSYCRRLESRAIAHDKVWHYNPRWVMVLLEY
jgi:hypothetical protein